MPDATAAPAPPYRYLGGAPVFGHADVEADGVLYEVFGHGAGNYARLALTVLDPLGRRLDRYECRPGEGLCDCGEPLCVHLALVRALKEGGHL